MAWSRSLRDGFASPDPAPVRKDPAPVRKTGDKQAAGIETGPPPGTGQITQSCFTKSGYRLTIGLCGHRAGAVERASRS